MNSVDVAFDELVETVPVELWEHLEFPPSGCFKVVRGARSGSWHRYPCDKDGRIWHRIVWEFVHGETDQLLVPVVCADRLCTRASHYAPMNWVEAHHFWRQRRTQASHSGSPDLPAVPLHPHPSSRSEDVSARYYSPDVTGRPHRSGQEA